MDWPNEIRTLMEDRDLSQRELATKIGMSATYIGDVLGGKPASPMLKLKILDMRGYDLASAAVLRLLLPKEVAEELVAKEKLRARANMKVKRKSGAAADEECGEKAAV